MVVACLLPLPSLGWGSHDVCGRVARSDDRCGRQPWMGRAPCLPDGPSGPWVERSLPGGPLGVCVGEGLRVQVQVQGQVPVQVQVQAAVLLLGVVKVGALWNTGRCFGAAASNW